MTNTSKNNPPLGGMTAREIQFVIKLILKPPKYRMVTKTPVPPYIEKDEEWRIRIHELLESPAQVNTQPTVS